MADLRTAADAGDRVAMEELGSIYLRGLDVAQDYQRAMGWYLRAAAAGDPAAMRIVGSFYVNGQGVPQDLQQAVGWYGKAADSGDADAMVNLGVLYDVGQGVRQGIAQNQQQATEWYRKAAALGNQSARKRLAELGAVFAQPTRIDDDHSIINLLSLIDVQKDAVAGTWEFSKGTLMCDVNGFGRIEIPYKPPAEYDFRITFTRTTGSAVVQICCAQDHAFMWQAGGWGDRFAGFECINGFGADAPQNPTRAILSLENGKLYTSLVKVRKNDISAYLDDKLISELKTDYQDIRINRTMQLRRDDILGLGAQSAAVTIYSAEITEITGKGERLR